MIKPALPAQTKSQYFRAGLSMVQCVLALGFILSSPAPAKDHGQWDGYSLTDEQRAWFKSVTNRAGTNAAMMAMAIRSSTKCARTTTIGFTSMIGGF